jgi:hypothetical protein
MQTDATPDQMIVDETSTTQISNPTTSETITSEIPISEPLSSTIITSISQASTSTQFPTSPSELQLVIYTPLPTYHPDPNNLSQCISLFRNNFITRIMSIHEVTRLSHRPNVVRATWVSEEQNF